MLHLAKASGTSINMHAVFGLTPELGHQSLFPPLIGGKRNPSKRHAYRIPLDLLNSFLILFHRMLLIHIQINVIQNG